MEIQPNLPVQSQKKRIPVGLFVVIGLIALLTLGYLFIYPHSSSNEEENEKITEAPNPSSSETPINWGENFAPPPTFKTSVDVHESLLKNPTKTSSKLSLPATISVANLNSTLGSFYSNYSSAGASSNNAPAIQEVILMNSTSEVISLGGLMSVLLPEVFTPEVINLFEPDFTYLLYTANNSASPNYVTKLKSGVNLNAATTTIQLLEQSPNLKNLFLNDPGNPSFWKNNLTEGISNRELSYLNGATLNYGWLEDTLIISTSREAFEDILKRLR